MSLRSYPFMFLHYFNPGSEEAIGSGVHNYTPSIHVQYMFRDLACLPLWYANSQDVVWDESSDAELYVKKMRRWFPDLPKLFPSEIQGIDSLTLKAAPWGLAPNSLQAYQRLKNRRRLLLDIPQWQDSYKGLISRETSQKVFQRLKEILPDFQFPETPCFCKTIKEVIDYIDKSRFPLILKSPFSSSGRGLLWIRSAQLEEKEQQWINGVIRKQGKVSIEPALEKIQDFAMEFQSDGQGNIMYDGLSVFGTQTRGAYSGNILGSEHYRESHLLKFVPKESLGRIKDALLQVLSEFYGTIYAGNIGVDMLLYRFENEIRIHPCVEINMRQTMGKLAICLSNKLHKDTTGIFKIEFEKSEGLVLQKHIAEQQRYPIILDNGQIRSGYLNLCPITKQTHYWAYIIVE